jgi:hypothetical protein
MLERTLINCAGGADAGDGTYALKQHGVKGVLPLGIRIGNFHVER